jgi:hypothetical protein
MGKPMIIAKSGVVVLVAALLGGCVSAPTSGEVRMNPSVRHQVDLSGMTLSFETPSSALRPSRDFGAIRLVEDIDLAGVTASRVVFHGHWDGPNYQWLKTMGTLRILLTVKPWPLEYSEIDGCDAKAMAHIHSMLSLRQRFFERGAYNGVAPTMTVEKVRVAGRSAHSVSFRLDVPPGTTYVIPLDDRFFLELMFTSAKNSDPEEGWDELALREQQRFVDSLQLTGEKLGCVK